jgi:hypothetical protein
MSNVQWKTPDDGQREYPKHVEFFDKIKFGKLVHLFGFIKKKHACEFLNNQAVFCCNYAALL